MQWNEQKCNVFNIAKRMVRMLMVSKVIIDEEKRRASKSYPERLLNKEFARERNSLSQADTITSVPCLIDKDMVRESISKIKKGKAAVLSGVLSEMVITAGEAGVEQT